MSRLAFALAAVLVAATAAAQSLPPPPLDLRLSPATSAPVATPPASASSAKPAPLPTSSAIPDSPPGVYYGDTSGRIYAPSPRVAAVKCDDATYGQAQTHGAVSMGVMGGSHMSGNYQSATINVTKPLGSCEDPKGAVGITIHVGQSRFDGRRW